jgi:hypothetical protein
VYLRMVPERPERQSSLKLVRLALREPVSLRGIFEAKERVAFPSALRWFLLRSAYPLPHPTKLQGSLFRLVPAGRRQRKLAEMNTN